jgi:hypothetical protein
MVLQKLASKFKLEVYQRGNETMCVRSIYFTKSLLGSREFRCNWPLQLISCQFQYDDEIHDLDL